MKVTFHIVTSYYDRCLERQLPKIIQVAQPMNKH